jgi:hypothetical protein
LRVVLKGKPDTSPETEPLDFAAARGFELIIRPLAKIRNLAPDRGKGKGEKGKGTFMSAFLLFPFPYFCKKSNDRRALDTSEVRIGDTAGLYPT